MPSPKVSSTTMDFYAALKAMHNGKTITKLDWNNPQIYGLMKDAQIQIHMPDGFHIWTITEGDLLGQDFIILETMPDVIMN